MIKNDGVDGAHDLGGGIHNVASFKSLELMWNRHVNPMDSCAIKFLKCLVNLACLYFDTDVARIFSQIIKSRLMKLRG